VLIPLDPVNRAFRAGVRAGNIASQQLADLPPRTPYLVRLQYFWLKVGTYLNTAVADPSQERILAAYVEGAATAKPQTRLVLALDTTTASADTTAGQDDDADTDLEPDTDTGRQFAIAADLADIAQQIREGIDNGPVRVGSSRPIGDLTINLWT
jgi:hypothetical protein